MFKILSRAPLVRNDRALLLRIARKSIEAHFQDTSPSPGHIENPRLKKPQGAFVTLRKERRLRGCIGIINGVKPLYQTVQVAAEAAAFSDPRFSPLKKSELCETCIEISVIFSLKKISSIRKIRIHRDGVLVRSGDLQGLLLPQVATTNHWCREVFLEHACIKAGLEKDAWKESEVEIMSFRAEVFAEEPSEKPNIAGASSV